MKRWNFPHVNMTSHENLHWFRLRLSISLISSLIIFPLFKQETHTKKRVKPSLPKPITETRSALLFIIFIISAVKTATLVFMTYRWAMGRWWWWWCQSIQTSTRNTQLSQSNDGRQPAVGVNWRRQCLTNIFANSCQEDDDDHGWAWETCVSRDAKFSLRENRQRVGSLAQVTSYGWWLWVDYRWSGRCYCGGNLELSEKEAGKA